jgi:hypothetical protein
MQLPLVCRPVAHHWFDDLPGELHLKVAGAGTDSLALIHVDLHMIHLMSAPQRLYDGVGEAEHEQLLHRFLAEVMVYTIDLPLVVVLVQSRVQMSCILEIQAEGFLDDQPMSFLPPSR